MLKNTLILLLLPVCLFGKDYPRPKHGMAIISMSSPILRFVWKDDGLQVIQNEFVEDWSKNRPMDVVSRKDNPSIKATLKEILEYDKAEKIRLNAMGYLKIVNRKTFMGMLTKNELFFDGSLVGTGLRKVYKINSAIFVDGGVLCCVSTSRKSFSIEPLEIMFIDLKNNTARFDTIASGMLFDYRLAPLGN